VPGDATGPLRADDLVVRYLGAFGPAAVADFQAWSGMTRTGEIFDDLRPRLTTFRDEAGVELFDLPDAPRPHADTPSPVRFIAEYDNILVSHADRRRVISDDDRKRMASANGVVPGTVLVDGFVAGLWKVTGDRRQATLTVTTLRTLPKGHAGAVRDEGRRLLAVAAATAPSSQVVVDPG
jgi:hypothetical protein